MRTTLRTVRVIICALFASGIASSQSKVRKSAPEPTAFYEDCGDGRSCVFDNPLPLPDSVLDALRETKEARSMQDELEGLNGEQFSHLFRTVKAHLVGPKETDYVVMGGFPMGAQMRHGFGLCVLTRITRGSFSSHLRTALSF